MENLFLVKPIQLVKDYFCSAAPYIHHQWGGALESINEDGFLRDKAAKGGNVCASDK